VIHQNSGLSMKKKNLYNSSHIITNIPSVFYNNNNFTNVVNLPIAPKTPTIEERLNRVDQLLTSL
jgi:hypothetical protein